MKGDCSSSSSGDNMRSPSEGAEIELYRSRGAQVYLVDTEASVLMQKGELVLTLANHATEPLAALVAMVGDLQWPVGKDSPAMRIGERCFTYALHGLIYGLVLGEFTTAADIKKVEEILQEYASFEVLSELLTDVGEEKEKQVAVEAEADYWTRMALTIEKLSAGETKQDAFWASSRQIASSAPSRVSERSEVLSPRLRRRMQQMRRVSAVAKLVTKILVKGMIKRGSHVEVRGGGEGMAMASVNAVTMVVEAVENGVRSVVETVVQERERRKNGDKPTEVGPDAGDGKVPLCWTLSNLGLRMLYGASTTLISSGSVLSRSFSDTSIATSGSGDTSRLLSFSRSSSSSASPSPPPFFPPPHPTPSRNPSTTSPPPIPANNLFRHPSMPPPCLSTTTSLHRPTPARPIPTLAAPRRPPPFLPPPPRPSCDP